MWRQFRAADRKARLTGARQGHLLCSQDGIHTVVFTNASNIPLYCGAGLVRSIARFDDAVYH